MASVEVVVDQQCFWIQAALTISEQIEVFTDLLERSKNVDDNHGPKRPCMNPSPKTLLFDGRVPTLRFGRSRNGKVNDLIDTQRTLKQMRRVSCSSNQRARAACTAGCNAKCGLSVFLQNISQMFILPVS